MIFGGSEVLRQAMEREAHAERRETALGFLLEARARSLGVLPFSADSSLLEETAETKTMKERYKVEVG
ncbi:hypothetical protein [Bradyrhizobium sp. WU425]|uniref:hypothetical protein n=1 Tax=Bradyrhizobium sp. WU425 TaxID=187029 RepID=UPI001E643A92|nr:hypothetical protein [Bradyrhizobium canariense]UFW72873.1 hypothetical protein BcanWU425_03635 [Bradyrhizobium canariense]